MMLSIFSCAYCPFIYLLWRNVYSNPSPILKLRYFPFYCWIVLYIFWILDPYQIYNLENSSPILLSFYFMCPLKHKKFLFLMKSNLPIFSLIACALDVISKKLLSNARSYRFSSVSFQEFYSFSSYLWAFEFIFIYGVNYGPNFILLHVDIQLSQYHLLNGFGTLIKNQLILTIDVWVYF